MILSLGEDRCEGENDKVFTRSALIKSDLWRAGEEVKVKKENQLRRAYVRARKADCVKVLVSDQSSCAKWGRGEEKSPVCARLFPCFAQSIRVAEGRCRVGITVCVFPSCSVRCVVGAIVRAQASLRCRGGGLRDSPDPQEGDDGDQGEAEHVARGDAQHFVHFAAGWQTFEIATALAVEREENGRQEYERPHAQAAEVAFGTVEHDRGEGAGHGEQTEQQIEPMAGRSPDEHNQRAFPGAAVVVDVAQVVHHEQGVDHGADADAEQEGRGGETAGEGEEGADHRDDAEEHEDEHVAQREATQVGGVEEGACHAGSARQHKAGEQCQWRDGKGAQKQGGESQSRERRQHEDADDAAGHGTRSDPALCAGAFRSEAVVAVGAATVVDEVVDEVGGDLHQRGEERAEPTGNGCVRLERSDMAGACGGECQGSTGDHRHQGAG